MRNNTSSLVVKFRFVRKQWNELNEPTDQTDIKHITPTITLHFVKIKQLREEWKRKDMKQE